MDIDRHSGTGPAPNPAPGAGAGRPSQSDWLARLHDIGSVHGFFERLGPRHTALYVQEDDVLVVSFDDAARVLHRAEDALPLGFEAVKRRQWSLLNLMAFGRTWFRDDALFAFFDRLIDEDFFESFDHVVFVGAGPMCGHAAAAFSVAAPGAKVVAVSPVATLDRAAAPFETRFRRARRLNFTDRYGHAPDMLIGAERAYIVYDPLERADAAQAALFRGPNVQHLPTPCGGRTMLDFLTVRGTLDWTLRAAVNGRLKPGRWGLMTRPPRRADPGYLKRLMLRAEETGHPALARIVARHGAETTGDAVFLRRLSTGPEGAGPPPGGSTTGGAGQPAAGAARASSAPGAAG